MEGRGLKVDVETTAVTYGHDHESAISGFVGPTAATTGNTFNVPYIEYDKYGHITATGSNTQTVPTPAAYTGASGIQITDYKVGHSASPASQSFGQSTDASGNTTITLPFVSADTYGHITNKTTHTYTITGLQPAAEMTAYLTKSDASSTYLTKTDASTTYQTIADMNNYYTKGEVDTEIGKIGSYLTAASTASITNPSTKVIYLVKDTSVTGTDKYNEYIYLSATNTFELIGDTSIDLSNCIQEIDLVNNTQKLSGTTATIPAATTAAYGVVKVGSTAGTVASGIHTHTTANITDLSTTLSNYVTTATNTTLSSNVSTLAAASSTWNTVSDKLDITATTNWDITSYTGVSGIKINGHNVGHSAAYTAGTVGPASNTAASSVSIPNISYDIYGHITAASDKTFTLPTANGTVAGIVKLGTGASDAASGNHTHSNYVTTATTGSWDITSYTGASGIKVDGHTISISANYASADAAIQRISAVNNSTVLTGSAVMIPSATSSEFGLVKLGNTAGTVAVGDHTHPGMLLPGSADDGKIAVATWDSLASSGSVEWEDKPYELIHWDGTTASNIGIYQSAANILAQNMLPVLVADYPNGPGHFYPLNVIDGACGYHFKDYDNDIWVNTAGTISINENHVSCATSAANATRADSATSADLTNHVSDACSTTGNYIDIGWDTSAIGNAEEIQGAAVYVQRGDQILIKDASRGAICKYIHGNSTSGAPVCINENGFLVTSAKMALPYPAEQNGESWFAVRSNYDAINSTFFEVDVDATPARAGIWANATSGQNAWQGWLIYTDAKKNCLVGDVVVLTAAGATSPGRLAAVYTDDIYKTTAASFTLSESDFNIDPPKKGDMLRVVNTGSSSIQITYNDYNGTSRTKTIGVGNFITVLCLSNSGGTIKAAIANNN